MHYFITQQSDAYINLYPKQYHSDCEVISSKFRQLGATNSGSMDSGLNRFKQNSQVKAFYVIM